MWPSNFAPNYIPERNENLENIHENKEKIILPFVRIAQKTLFGTIAIAVKTIAIEERDRVQSKYSKDRRGSTANKQSEGVSRGKIIKD